MSPSDSARGSAPYQRPADPADRAAPSDPAGQAHGDLVGQPHENNLEGPVADAEATAARISTDDAPRGTLGRPFNRKAPFFVGLAATAGVAVTYGIIQLLLIASNILILIGLSLFLAIGMEPAVSWLVKRRLPRWAAVTTVLVLILAVIIGFLAAAVPALVTQIETLVKNVPQYLARAQDHSTFIGRLNEQFGLQAKITSLLNSSSSALTSGLIGAGVAVFNALTDTLLVLILTTYLLIELPRVRASLYRFVPHSRRPRAILIGDDILGKVGSYVLGNLAISAIAGLLTLGWLLAFGVPYAFLLSVMVALLDLVPVVGSTIGGVVVALVALTVSLPVCLLTIAFFIVYRFAEDYFLVPRIIGRAVEVPALITVVAVLIGGALLGILGALVAIPFAAALLLVTKEVWFPRLDLS